MGGFKGLVAYTVLIGMLRDVFRVDTFSRNLRRYWNCPRSPIEFQRSTFESYRLLFERMERDTSIPITEWEQAVPFHERGLLQALVDWDSREVTLSGVGLLFLDEIRTPSLHVPFLSHQAWEDRLNNLAGLANCDPFRSDEWPGLRKPLGLAEHINPRQRSSLAKTGKNNGSVSCFPGGLAASGLASNPGGSETYRIIQIL